MNLKYFRHILLLWLVAIASLVTGAAYSQEPLWPINAPQYITSSFGEPRPGRFHCGIDCKSGGVIGKEVYSLGDGYVSRLAVSPTGYGRAIYIQLDSGRIVLYGHLSKFIPELEERVYNLRIKKGSSDLDWWPEKDLIRVSAGQLIAWSGDSGSWGQPHLHFEIRDQNNNPVNPFSDGYRVTDSQSPQIGNIVLIPLDPQSSVDGYTVPRWIKGASGTPSPHYLSGRVGVAVSTLDTADGMPNQLGIYELTLAVDDEIIFSKRYDELSYNYTGNGVFDYLPGSFFGGSGTISALFRHPGIAFPFYQGDGIIHVSAESAPAERVLTITARDYAGNMTRRSLPVVFGAVPYFTWCGFTGENGAIRVEGGYSAGTIRSIELCSRTAEQGWRLVREYPVEGTTCEMTIEPPEKKSEWRVVLISEQGVRSNPAVLMLNSQPAPAQKPKQLNVRTRLNNDQITVELKAERPFSTIPRMQVTANGEEIYSGLCMIPDGETSWIQTVPFKNPGENEILVTVSAVDPWGDTLLGSSSVSCWWLDAFKNASLTSDDSLMTVFVPQGSLFRSAPAYITTERSRPANGLRPLSSLYRLTFADLKIKTPLLARIKMSGDIPPHAAVFAQSGSRWSFLSKKVNGDIMTTNLGAAVCVGVFEDTAPPVITPKSPAAGSTVISVKPVISVAVSDAGSGLAGSDSIRLKLDGEPIYGDFNPSTGVVRYEPRYAVAQGAHTVEVRVTDFCGNVTTRNWQFTIAAQ